eukprot:UN28279
MESLSAVYNSSSSLERSTTFVKSSKKLDFC